MIFLGDYLSSSLKELITITLYKEGKKDYSLSNSYRLITLKNTLIKVIKKALII